MADTTNTETDAAAETVVDNDADADWSEDADEEGPTDPPSIDYDLTNIYNPNNLTWDELEMLLYEWEEEAAPVNEYFDFNYIRYLRTGEYDDDDWVEEESKSWLETVKDKAKEAKDKAKELAATAKDTGSRTTVEYKKTGPKRYMNLTADTAHIVEFYAPWCPHCQHYKWEYVEIATEISRRSITPVEFHAISCDVYDAICRTYEITGFPTILGWKEGDSLKTRGIELNEEADPEADDIAEMLELDMAHEAVELWDWSEETQNEEHMAIVKQKLIEQGEKAASTKKLWHEHQPQTHNDRYHNAALSLAFAVKSQLFQTLTEDGKMEPKRKSALVDFLNLLDWATPQSWKLRSGFIKELAWKMDADALKDRSVVESLIDADMDQHRADGTQDLWGFVDAIESGWTGKMFAKKQEKLVRDDKHWTKACTHSVPAKGFTCGLWNLFHILTIGSSKPEHELYGFHRGYLVSPHAVAKNIADFVAYFFSCDVCRTNFLHMYENCGHDHCKRLKSEITTGSTDGSDPARMELALWLWEVHNSVNVRLMTEAAQRQNREVTHEETLASLFPTKEQCPDCWLDANGTKWDNTTVFHFLEDWYWPNNEPAVIAGTSELEEGKQQRPTSTLRPVRVDASKSEQVESSTSASSLGVGFTTIFCLIAFSLLVVAAAQKKRREKRKKFVDSRFVKKKQGCLK